MRHAIVEISSDTSRKENAYESIKYLLLRGIAFISRRTPHFLWDFCLQRFTASISMLLYSRRRNDLHKQRRVETISETNALIYLHEHIWRLDAGNGRQTDGRTRRARQEWNRLERILSHISDAGRVSPCQQTDSIAFTKVQYIFLQKISIIFFWLQRAAESSKRTTGDQFRVRCAASSAFSVDEPFAIFRIVSKRRAFHISRGCSSSSRNKLQTYKIRLLVGPSPFGARHSIQVPERSSIRKWSRVEHIYSFCRLHLQIRRVLKNRFIPKI